MNPNDIQVGSKIKFSGERMAYTVQARSDRYLVCTKPFAARSTVLYTIVDMVNKVRGGEDLVFGEGFETGQDCNRAIDRLEGRGNGPRTEVSFRNRVALSIVSVH